MVSGRWVARAVLAVVVLALVSPAVYGALTYDPAQQTALRRGTIERPANGTTIISVQGFSFQGHTSQKKPARLVAVGPRGGTKWVYTPPEANHAWFYSVDPLPNGNLLVDSPRGGHTVVYELNPKTKERVWTETLPFEDTHDVELLDEQHLLVANMRQWDAKNGTSNDRVLIYNRTNDSVQWQWKFENHYPANTDGGMKPDWTHVNDVDNLGDGRIMVSVRNFDQVIVIDRKTGRIVDRLGRDDAHGILNEQHNPDYLVSDNGTPTILVADSENDRVVEYAKENGRWRKTWEVGTGQLKWPRDADRLPNGDTLITDTLHHRVIEVTPTGRIVWEYYATWGPYEADRVATGGGSHGPTMRDMNASGTYRLHGSAGLSPGTGDRLTFAAQLRAALAGTPLEGPAVAFAHRWSHVTPWIRPVWLTNWQFAFAVAAALVALVWGTVELVLARGRIATGLLGAVRGGGH
ncbi:MAG: aryl-sulfate sulfotransferase [Salinigranum sp.]